MQPGRLLFPVLMVGFTLFFFTFVLTTPVHEAPESADSRFVRARDGDSVLVEFTAYFGEPGRGTPFFSTQEERADSLPPGIVQEDPIAIHLSADQPAGGLRANLIGKRAGDTFTTAAVPPRDAFGDWDGERTLPRLLVEFPYMVRFDPSVRVGGGGTFNTSQYLAFWKSRNYDLQLGSTWPCEGPELWDCRVEELSIPRNEFAYSRVVSVGEAYPVAPFWASIPVGGDMSWNVSIQPASTSDLFAIHLDPPIGTRFQLRQGAGDLPAGTYLVKSLTDEEFVAYYTVALPSQPGLIGATVYYDVEILNITRRP